MGDHFAQEYLASDDSSSSEDDLFRRGEISMTQGLRREIRAVKRKIRDLVHASSIITLMVCGVPVDLDLHEVQQGGLQRAAAHVQADPHMRAQFLASVDEELERLRANWMEIQVYQQELDALTHSLNEIS